MKTLTQLNRFDPMIHEKYFMSDDGQLFVKKNDPLATINSKTIYITKKLISKGARSPYQFNADICFYKNFIYRKLKPWNDNPIIRIDKINGSREVYYMRDLVRLVS